MIYHAHRKLAIFRKEYYSPLRNIYRYNTYVYIATPLLPEGGKGVLLPQ